jgi:hypothetical protein
MQRLLPFALFALVTGCAQEPPQVPEAPPPPVFAPGECDAANVQSMVGQAYNSPLGEDARQRSRAERVRAVRPGDMITMEFDAHRLTIELDGDGKVTRARCS